MAIKAPCLPRALSLTRLFIQQSLVSAVLGARAPEESSSKGSDTTIEARGARGIERWGEAYQAGRAGVSGPGGGQCQVQGG